VWKPSSPHQIVSTPAEGVDWCLDRITEAGLKLPRSKEGVRREALRVLTDL
jgi:hypothetical protein